MKKEEFYFDSRDNSSRIHALRYTPDDGNVRAVVQIVHGMAEYVERYEEFAQFLTDRGFAVTGEDHLGHGKSAGENGYGYFCSQDPATVVVRDVHRLKKLTQQLYPSVPYIILGHSMGSFILRNYLCRYGTGISGAIIMGTGMQPQSLLLLAKGLVALCRVLKGEKHVSKLLETIAFGSYNQRFEPARTRMDWLSKDEKKVDEYIADPICGFTFTVNGFGTLFELIYRLYDEANLKKMPGELPVLVVSGEDDPVGEFGKGVRRTIRSLESAGMKNLTCKLYTSDRHELLNETDRGKVMEDICSWMGGNDCK